MSAGPTTRRIGSVVAELLPSRVQLVAEERRRQGCVDEAGRDQVHADGRGLEREVPDERGLRGGERRDQRESRRGAAATGTAHEEQRPSRAHRVRRVASDLDRQQQMGLDVAACRVEVELRERRVVRTGTGDEHVVDRRRQLVEERSEPFEVRGVEGRDARADLGRGVLEPP